MVLFIPFDFEEEKNKFLKKLSYIGNIIDLTASSKSKTSYCLELIYANKKVIYSDIFCRISKVS